MSSATILSRQPASANRTSLSSPPIQQQVDGLVSGFIQEASDPRVLASMTSAGTAYRLGRIGVIGLGNGQVAAMPLRLLSIGVGLGSEVAAFELTNRTLQTFFPSSINEHSSPNLWSWSGTGGWKRGLATSALTFGMLKSAGFLARGENILLQHTLQSTSMVAGHQVASSLQWIPKPQGSLAEQFLHAEATNLQLAAGTQLAHSLFPEIHAMERGLDLSLESGNVGAGIFPPSIWPHLRARGFAPLQPNFSMEGPVGGDPTVKEKSITVWEAPHPKEATLGDNLLPMTFDPDQAGGKSSRFRKYGPLPPLTPFQRDSLQEKWEAALSRVEGEKSYAEQTLEHVFKIRSSLPGLHEKILKVFANSPKAGELDQYYAAERLKWLFNFNALASSTGSLENAVLQFLIEEAASDPRPEGTQALRWTLNKMEGSPSAFEFVDLIQRFGYDRGQKISDQKITSSDAFYRRYRETAASRWIGLQPSHRILLFNYVARSSGENGRLAEKMIELFANSRNDPDYSQKEFDLALTYASQSPLTELLLDRMLHVFITQDHPGKLTELSDDFWPEDPLTDIPQWIAKGASIEEVAQKINGTRYTAYILDSVLAEKIVTVSLEANDYFNDPSKAEESQAEFHRALMKELNKSQPLTVSQMMELLIKHPTRLAQEIYRAWYDGELQVKFVTKGKMDGEVESLREMVAIQNLFKKGEDGKPDRILLLLPSKYDIATPEEEEKAYTHYGFAFGGIVHEGQHSKDAPFRNVHRHDRIVSEMIADLEEFNWDIRNFTNNFQKMGQGLGNRLPLFLRSLGEHNYYRRTNERLVRQFIFGKT